MLGEFINYKMVKFRAWDKERHIFAPDAILTTDGICRSLETGEELIPLLFTGLVDKNNKEIYVGDVIRTNGGYSGDFWCEGSMGEVVFDPPEFFLDYNNIAGIFQDNPFRDCEIIGNIFETDLH